MSEPRLMRREDIPAVEDLANVTFADLARRHREPVSPPDEPGVAHVRLRRVLATDPGGCWVVPGADGTLAGAAIAILREGIWGLSLLAVRPRAQSSGLGRTLLERALSYGDGARGGIIVA